MDVHVTQAPFSVTPQEGIPPDSGEDLATVEKRRALLALARDRFKVVSDAESQLRLDQKEDLEFVASEQWDNAIRDQRRTEGRPCLTINRLPQFIRQAVNQIRENKPAIQVSPVDDLADPETAEVFSGLIKHIEQRSNAVAAYTTAAEAQTRIGRGWIRLLTEYVSDGSREQEARIRRVRNPFMVFPDPAYQELDGSDMKYCFVTEDLTLEEFKARFKGKRGGDLGDFDATGADVPSWFSNGRARVAEYWYVDTAHDVVLELETGDHLLLSTVPPDALPPPESSVVAGDQATEPSQAASSVPLLLMPVQGARVPVQVVERTPIERKVVKCAIISGADVLDGNPDLTEGRVWPGERIPLFPVIGDEVDLDGRVDLRGVVRDAKDPQRRYNYAVSAETETAALAPKAPFVAAEGQIEGHEKEWRTANMKNWAVLQYKPTTASGHLVPPPQRNTAEPPIGAMVQLVAQADNDLKAVTGRFDASLGSPGPEQSGKAILARQKQGDIGNYHYGDNLNHAIAAVGRELVAIIPKIYDAPRVMRILGTDDQMRTVMVYAGQQNRPADEMVQAKQINPEHIYDLGVGRYDVTVQVGPSYASRRQEAAASMIQFIQAYPNAFPIIGDLLAKNMDWPGAQAIALRLKKMLPPQVAESEDGAQPIPPQLQQQMQQMAQMNEALVAEVKKLTTEIESKQNELSSKERNVVLQEQTKIAIAELNASVQLGLQSLKEQDARLERHLEHLHERVMATVPPPPSPSQPAGSGSTGA